VVGLGRVGLPTAVALARSGCHVYAVDINAELVEKINCGIDPFGEPGLQPILRHVIRRRRLVATTDIEFATSECGAVIVCVPTQVKERRTDLSHITNAVTAIARTLRKKDLVIIVSSIPPGTVKGLLIPLLGQSGLRVEEDFYLAYAPERMAPGSALKDIKKNLRLVGAAGPASSKAAVRLLRGICDNLLVTDIETTEVSKLAENAFRDVNIAFANELGMLCERLGVDANKVIEAANSHPRVRIHKLGPGVGGPCLTKDSWLLLNAEGLEGLSVKIIPAAREVNEGMPGHVVGLTRLGLSSVGKNLARAKIGVLGTAYKGGTSDTRLSPSEHVIRHLIMLGSNVTAYDPYSSETFGATRAFDVDQALENSDCIIFLTDHSEFARLGLRKIRSLMSDKPVIVDARRMINPESAMRLGFKFFGVGYPLPKTP